MTAALQPNPASRPPYGSPGERARQEANLRRRLSAPAWAFDRDYVTSYALEMLPRVCAEMGCGRARGFLPSDATNLTRTLSDAMMAWHIGPEWNPDRHVLRLGLTADAEDELLIHRAIGDWAAYTGPDRAVLIRRGACIVSLAAWRWSSSEAKAAKRLARILAMRGTLP